MATDGGQVTQLLKAMHGCCNQESPSKAGNIANYSKRQRWSVANFRRGESWE
jgi:hypothetical protein